VTGAPAKLTLAADEEIAVVCPPAAQRVAPPSGYRFPAEL